VSKRLNFSGLPLKSGRKITDDGVSGQDGKFSLWWECCPPQNGGSQERTFVGRAEEHQAGAASPINVQAAFGRWDISRNAFGRDGP
jgi:hypothetical protein